MKTHFVFGTKLVTQVKCLYISDAINNAFKCVFILWKCIDFTIAKYLVLHFNTGFWKSRDGASASPFSLETSRESLDFANAFLTLFMMTFFHTKSNQSHQASV